MITIKKTQVFLTLALLAMVCNAHALPLTGQTLSGSTIRMTRSTDQAVVGDGVEFTVGYGTRNYFDIDFTESGLVTVGWVQDHSLIFGVTEVLRFSDALGTIDDIIGLNLISSSNATDLTQDDLSFGPDHISVYLRDTRWRPGGQFSAQIDFATPTPEPATILLLSSGLIGIVGFRRKFKK